MVLAQIKKSVRSGLFDEMDDEHMETKMSSSGKASASAANGQGTGLLSTTTSSGPPLPPSALVTTTAAALAAAAASGQLSLNQVPSPATPATHWDTGVFTTDRSSFLQSSCPKGIKENKCGVVY